MSRTRPAARRVWQFAVFATVAAWAAASVVGRHIALEVPPMALSVVRNGAGGLVAALVHAVTMRQPLDRPHGRDWGPLSALAVLGVLLQLPLFHLALAYTTATQAMVIWSLSPVLVAVLAPIYLGEGLSQRKWLGVAVATLGTAGFMLGGGGALVGNLLALASAAAMAGFTLLVRRLGDAFTILTMTVHVNLLGALMILPFALWERGTGQMAGHPWAVAFLVLVTGLGRWAWNAGVARLGAVETAAYMYLQPVMTAVLAYAFIGEAITVPLVLAGGLILLGTYWVQSGPQIGR